MFVRQNWRAQVAMLSLGGRLVGADDHLAVIECYSFSQVSMSDHQVTSVTTTPVHSLTVSGSVDDQVAGLTVVHSIDNKTTTCLVARSCVKCMTHEKP